MGGRLGSVQICQLGCFCSSFLLIHETKLCSRYKNHAPLRMETYNIVYCTYSLLSDKMNQSDLCVYITTDL